jgi:FKBP-type peptidyl-prolyl cis-trans isomerase
MKNTFNALKILAVFAAVMLAASCGADGADDGGTGNTLSKDESYAFGINEGMYLTEYLGSNGITIDSAEFIKGVTDFLTDGKMRMTPDEANTLLDAAFAAFFENAYAEEAQRASAFMAENSRKPGVVMTASGLQFEVIEETGGVKPGYFDTVLVHYTGKLQDGTLFDSSYVYGEPALLPLSRVVPGWSEGVQLMGLGSKYVLYVPPDLGYGAAGVQGVIPPNAVLIFEVELLEIESGGQ